MDKITLKSKAVKKVSILNPPTILVQIKIMMALITNKNSPNVKMVKGNVNNTKIGFMKILSNPKTTATKSEVIIPVT